MFFVLDFGKMSVDSHFNKNRKRNRDSESEDGNLSECSSKSESESETETSESNTVKAKKKSKKSYDQKYKPDWEKKLNWICPSPLGDYTARCKICKVDLQGSFTQIQRHGTRKKHLELQRNINISKKSIFESAKEQASLMTKVKEAEIQLGLFFVEHNLAFNVADHLMHLLPKLDPNSLVLKNLGSRRTKCSAIVKGVIGTFAFEEIVEILKVTPFSIMIDESTDISTNKHLVIVARFEMNFVPHDVFLTLIELSKDGTHEAIYNLLINFFKDNGIPYAKNMIGFGSDGANVLMGRHHSVSTLLKRDIPGLFILKCVCHSLALCASYAAEKLPKEVEETIKSVHGYFKNSSNRVIGFQEIQAALKQKRHKLLKLHKVRWLSLRDCVQRVLSQEKALLAYFGEEAKTSSEANAILVKIAKPSTFLYLKFLDYVLPLVTDRNSSFQSENPKIGILYTELETMYRSILKMYLKDTYVENNDVSVIQYRIPDKFKPNDKLYLGPKAMADIAIKKYSSKELDVILVNCRHFLIELAHQIYQRFPFDDNQMQALKYISFIEPDNIKEFTSIAPAYHFFNFGNPNSFLTANIETVDAEFLEMKNFMKDFNSLDRTRYWMKVGTFTKGDSSQRFGNILKFVKYILSLPHSSAACERAFSAVNLNKIKPRNRIKTSTLNGIMLGKTYLTMKNQHCYSCTSVKNMVRRHNVEMYKEKPKP